MAFSQQLDDLQVALVGCQMQRCPALLCWQFKAGPIPEQHLADKVPAPGNCSMQWAVAILIKGIRGCPTLQQVLDGSHFAPRPGAGVSVGFSAEHLPRPPGLSAA